MSAIVIISLINENTYKKQIIIVIFAIV